MESIFSEVQPKLLWSSFERLNAIPRASKKEQAVIDMLFDFAKENNLKVKKDQIGNVLICKSASKGFENRPVVALQSHIDMVHQKNERTVFDFETQGIQMYIDDQYWVRAKGTTLGADNGIGVAAMMAVLQDKSLDHPPLEALFTVDEETAMSGAFALSSDLLTAKRMLNLDTEEEEEICIGCAGGVDLLATRRFDNMTSSQYAKPFLLRIDGLQGGHSGIDIHKGLANANVLLFRILYVLNQHINTLQLSTIEGGNLRNVIPRESKAIVYINENQIDTAQSILEDIAKEIALEFSSTEPSVSISLKACLGNLDDNKVLNTQDQSTLLAVLNSLHNGVYTMSQEVRDLVITSNNIARVVLSQGMLEVNCLLRSSLSSQKKALSDRLTATFSLIQAEVVLSGAYPGWVPKLNTHLLQTTKKVYQDLFKQEPHVMAVHAGLECGIIGECYPDMDMVSFGPTIKGAHSPDEKVSIASTERFYNFLKELLANL